MMLFRSAKAADEDAIYELASQSGAVGITTLPKEASILEKRLRWSQESFLKPVNHAGHEYYFFVLEDPENKKIVGTSAIDASTGFETPFYSYKLSRRTRICPSLGIRTDYEVLHLVNDYQDCTEICTLFLREDYRKNNYGLLLSRARFLFIAEFPNRFNKQIIAEMRGISDEAGATPFWDFVGSHFFQMSFAKADSLTLSTNKQFIADLMPRQPIYVKLLSPEVQNVIGKPHHSTVAAMKILLHEGFHYNNYVDIFDAGPTIEAKQEDIRTLAKSLRLTIRDLSDKVKSIPYLVANTQLNFRATIAEVIFNESEKSGIISKDTAALLALRKGDAMRVFPLQGV